MSWRKEKLSNICHMKTGKLDSNAAVPDGEFPFFTCAQETYRINIAAYDTEAVLLGGNNAAGIFPLKYYNGPFNAYQRTYILESLDSSKLSTRFLYYALKPALSLFQSASIGAATQYLTKPILENFQISLPSIESQNKIVSILSVYDDLIENNRRRIQLLEEAARLLYQEWFVRLRFPGHENTKIVDGVPEGWESLSLIEALELQRGFDLPLKNIEPGDVPVYGSTGIIGYHNVSKVKGPGIITGRSGSLGIVQYVLNDYWPHNTALWVKTFKKVTPLFALYLLRNLKLEQYNGGVSVPTLDRKVVHRIQIIIPPPRIMNEFESSCSDSYALMMNLSQQNTNLIKARDLLIPRLMNGVIPV